MKCSSFLSDVRRQCGERDDWPNILESDDPDERPRKPLQLRINRGGRKQSTSRTSELVP